MNLRPTLWRTCRVLASERRLKLLWLIFKEREIYVQQMAERTGMSVPNASNQLRALSARGLISLRRKKMMVIYRAEANNAVNGAQALLESLKICYAQNISFKTMIRQATAFTHERRIEIINALTGTKYTLNQLAKTTGISTSALARHLEKLKTRGFVKIKNGFYSRSTPGNPLGRTLLKLACADK